MENLLENKTNELSFFLKEELAYNFNNKYLASKKISGMAQPGFPLLYYPRLSYLV